MEEPRPPAGVVRAACTRRRKMPRGPGQTRGGRRPLPPPVWDDDEEHVVTATWTVEGPKEWWAAAVAARHDPTASDWWRSMEPMVIERTRTTEAEPAAVERMSRV